MKTKKRTVYFSGTLILLIFFSLFIIAGYISRPFNGKADKITKSLYSDDADVNDIDVAWIGGSHAQNGFNPSVLYRDYGIRSFNYAYSGSPLFLNYYYLEELYKKHDFKVVVLDLCYAGVRDAYFEKDEYVFEVVSNMRFSKEKIKFIQEHISPENRLSYYFPAFRYHSRLLQLTKADIFREPISTNDFFLGSDYHKEQYSEELGIVHFDSWNNTDECSELPEMVELYLNKIIALTKAHNSKLLFTVLPYNYNKSGLPVPWVDDEYTNYNSVRKLAEKNNIPMLEYDDSLLDEIGFIPEEHMFNPGHMNLNGSELITSHLGKYLTDNYDLTQWKEGDSPLWDSYVTAYQNWKTT